jgi:hypothetical protein
LNLATANRVFLVEPQWNPSVENQAVARALRLGQEQAVIVTRYVVDETVELVSNSMVAVCTSLIYIADHARLAKRQARKSQSCGEEGNPEGIVIYLAPCDHLHYVHLAFPFNLHDHLDAQSYIGPVQFGGSYNSYELFDWFSICTSVHVVPLK